MEQRIEIESDGGTLDVRLFTPDTDGPWPLVVFFMDAGGLRPVTTAMAGRLTEAGYAVVQPNLYWRSGPLEPFDLPAAFSDEAARQRLFGLARSVEADEAMADMRASIAAARAADPRIDANRIGCVGYCLGGRMAFVAATAMPDRVVAAASIHGGGLVTDAPDSPHRAAANIEGVVYLGVADDDPSCTPEHQQALREALDAAGVQYTMELYPGARHGFAMTDFPVFDVDASERHWERVLALFDAELRI